MSKKNKTLGYTSLDGKHSDDLVEKVSKHQLIYSIFGLVLGIACILGGVMLFLKGVTGKMGWSANFKSVKRNNTE